MDKNIGKLFFATILAFSIPLLGQQDTAPKQDSDPAWAQLSQSMEKMHAEMRSIKPSGSDDTDFVRLMLVHHQAALDMARVELTRGKDPQMRRLAQEIIVDQQSEIDLMHLWLKHDVPVAEIELKSPTRPERVKYESYSILVDSLFYFIRIRAASTLGPS